MKTPDFWQRRGILAYVLLPVSWLYYAVNLINRTIQKWSAKAQAAEVKVICIGNVTAGGGGKTPTVQMLVKLLIQCGHIPHIISRGYGGNLSSNHPLRVNANHSAEQVGDEPRFLSEFAPVWVGYDRKQSIAAAISAGATVILADDGFQNPTFYKDISLLVMNRKSPLGNGLMLPAGPLREPLSSAINRTDAVVMVGTEGEYSLHITKPCWDVNVEPKTDLSALQGKPLIAFAGLANPQKFYDFLVKHSLDLIKELSFADHHFYSSDDIKKLQAEASELGAILVTTQKDAVKLPPEFLKQIQVVAIEYKLKKDSEFTEWLEKKLVA